MAEQTILVVEDDEEIRDIIRVYLEAHQFRVIGAGRGDEAVRLVETMQPDLLILDVLLPGKDGFEVCKEVRAMSSAPILFLSCKKDEQDKITGLELGGDDYITKPFSPNELIARVKANLRRPHLSGEAPNRMRFGAVELDPVSRSVTVNRSEVTLSRKEFDLLYYLARHPGRTVTHEELFREIWDQEMINDTRTIIVHVSNLRKKIETDPANPKHIINVHGVGYKFILPLQKV
ncbi:Transcriptional regulatory protein YycF [Paenibacillus konkukensis]|uniref:Transcriptional regulatory protein YycF n=1 Tax=Paenibacillus konkukensis TaxID=2020716 RepID=A0ABY4RVL6_9BACL|nr:response regulator transcription factor [Paenibacillus konkukensis]UQZ86063.1 Transcriptional regulatory protein YycF [Paenibacillus konkukensis]